MLPVHIGELDRSWNVPNQGRNFIHSSLQPGFVLFCQICSQKQRSGQLWLRQVHFVPEQNTDCSSVKRRDKPKRDVTS
jgi:hypothetical protein